MVTILALGVSWDAFPIVSLVLLAVAVVILVAVLR
jgi:hypothetical protein